MAGLASIELLGELSPDAVAELEAQATWHHFAPDEQVFDQESDAFEVYFVVSGSVRILSYVHPDREVALANVGAGNYFGELAAIDGKGRSARVVAIEQSVLASVEGPVFMAFMRRNPSIAVHVLERFARIIRTLDSRVADLSTLSESQRIMVELVRLAEADPFRGEGFFIADLPNHKEIAMWAGAGRDAVARTIGELARVGVVERRSMSLIIKDWERLRAMARATEPSHVA